MSLIRLIWFLAVAQFGNSEFIGLLLIPFHDDCLGALGDGKCNSRAAAGYLRCDSVAKGKMSHEVFTPEPIVTESYDLFTWDGHLRIGSHCGVTKACIMGRARMEGIFSLLVIFKVHTVI